MAETELYGRKSFQGLQSLGKGGGVMIGKATKRPPTLRAPINEERPSIDAIMRGAGIEGDYNIYCEYEHEGSMFPSCCQLRYKDERTQFLYELKGGDNYFGPYIRAVIVGCIMDEYKKQVEEIKSTAPMKNEYADYAKEYLSGYTTQSDSTWTTGDDW
jgi:hypothetical protein